jgi:hypothetical protein
MRQSPGSHRRSLVIPQQLRYTKGTPASFNYDTLAPRCTSSIPFAKSHFTPPDHLTTMPPQSRQRLVRRRSLWQRVTAVLDPRDFLLWLSEEVETREWSSSKTLGVQIGLGMSILFLLARANSRSSEDDDDIFEDDEDTWLFFVVGPIVPHMLPPSCV